MRGEGRLAGAAGKASVNTGIVRRNRMSAGFAWDPAQDRRSAAEQYRHTAVQRDGLASESIGEDNAANLRSISD